MKMDDMVLISVDDHITEPANVFDNQLSGEALASAPKLRTSDKGTNYWEYQGARQQSIALNAVVGRPREEYGMEPTALTQLRKGCYDVHARVDDMDANGIAASVNFSSLGTMDGGTYINAPDKKLALTHLRAHNDWHIDEWCGAYPERFIPLGMLPMWDAEACAAEVHRLAAKGCFAVAFNDNPTARGLPGIHHDSWEPLWKAISDTETTICLHIGVGNPSPHASPESPIEGWITTMPLAVAFGAADWINLSALQRYPNMRISLSESGIGWIPYLLERADYSHEQHYAWTHSKMIFGDQKPSEIFKKHFTSCFIDDAYGLRNTDLIGEDNICFEVDYPHSDTPWPNSPEVLWKSIQQLPDQQIDKITHLNAMRDFRFNLFDRCPKAEMTVGALRARAAQKSVDTSIHSNTGEAPLAANDQVRPVTSQDLAEMFARHAAEA